ncbi:MAG: hypothetical protein L6277_14730 [Desulfobacterales bacterium]|nr:hypothetical protein [Pseudomonadota bacterium]MBU4355977.1 hypothetical protein [Pseudomonadota bacterium]MCG2773330.1 hypothetical protein [Desulfobacterales bacterium]
MMRLMPIFLGFLLLVGHGATAWAASAKATALRQANGLTGFTPPEKFLAENFVADEMNPGVIFGAVKTFAASRKCPTTWLIESVDKNRPAGPGSPGMPAEYTLYLEEDCPDQVVYYVFIDQSGLTPQQWIEWREKFHKSKAGEQFASAKSKLDLACTAGCGVGAELRFIQKNGELVAKSPEAVLRQDLKFAPIYDLNQGKKLTK